MFAGFIFATVTLPLTLGLALGCWNRISSRGMVVVTAVLLLVLYVNLEGIPPFPPTASKQKLTYVIAAAALSAPFLHRARMLLTLCFLVIATLWLGWNKLGHDGLLGLAPAAVPVALGAWGSRTLSRPERGAFVWPLALLALCLAGAGLAVDGVFMGFAQVSGAIAAFLGGALLVGYASLLMGRDAALPEAVLSFLMLSGLSVLVVIGLFAPEIDPLAVAVASLTLLMPGVVPAFAKLPKPVRPVLQAILTSIPAVAALALAFLAH